MIRRCEFERVLATVRASGVADEFEDLLNPHHTGAPRTLSVSVYLTCAILAAKEYKSTTQTAIHRLLSNDLAHSLRVRHGLSVDGRKVDLSQVYYLLGAMAARLKTPRNPDGGNEATLEDDILDELANRLARCTLPDQFANPRRVAMDATSVKSFARGTRREANPDAATDPDATTVEPGTAADPDASWGFCTRTQDNGSNRVFGYDAFTLVGVPAAGSPSGSMPILTVGLRLRPAGRDVVEPGLQLLKEAVEHANEAGTALLPNGAALHASYDRAWSYKLPDRWAQPVRALGVDPVFDLHPTDRGVREHEGVLMVDGYPFCPALPAHLHHISRPQRFSVSPLKPNPTARERLEHARATAALARFHAELAAREPYAFRRVAGPDAAGKERFECPAQAGKIVCENCPLSAHLLTEFPDTPQVVEPPEVGTAPKCCTQRSITLPGAVDAKRRQRLRWGTPDWVQAYNMRTHVEGSYGNLKSSTGGNLRRGWCHARGRVRVGLMLACAVAASNLAVLRSWAEKTGNIHLPFCEPDPPDYGFEEIDADGDIDFAPPPPDHSPPPG